MVNRLEVASFKCDCLRIGGVSIVYSGRMFLIDKLLKRPSAEQQAIEEYNAGLKAKYAGNWDESLARNQRAARLNPTDQATWWNLAIAATALHDWPEARRAWIACGVTPNESDGEVTTLENWACVRLVPSGAAEVVWGKRIDPARIKVMNVPLPESDRLYGDIILNDGAQEGTRVSRGQEFPVFDELAVWRRSEFSTYRIEVEGASEESRASLARICEENEVPFEDWGTVRILCEACSRGNPGVHECSNAAEPSGPARFGFAAKGLERLRKALTEWREVAPEVRFGEAELLVSGVSQ